jgi:3-oxoacyl-[acyl-carrier-protein] synthase-1
MSVALVFVRAVGMACPVGLTARTACAAFRAGLNRFSETEYLDNGGEPVVGSFLERLDGSMSRMQRCFELLWYALRDVCQSGEIGTGALAELPMLVIMPTVNVEGTNLRDTVTAWLSAKLGVRLNPGLVEVGQGGSVASVRAIEVARQWLSERPGKQILVVAVDSYIEARALVQLARARRLLSSQCRDGVIPGEAAACVLLGPAVPESAGSIAGIGFGTEPSRLDNDVPLRGDGIAQAARRALAEAGLEMHDLDFRLSDAAGEAIDFKEQVLVVSKLLRRNKDRFSLVLPATSLGFTGAAAPLCALALAASTWQQGAAPGPRAITFATEADGNRAALVIEAPRSALSHG